MKYFDKKYSEYYSRAFRIAWPCIVETLLYSGVFIIDAIMVGNLGANESAAVGVNQAVNWLINSLSLGFSVGGTVLVARHCGADEVQAARNVARQAVFAAILFGFAMVFVIFNMSNYIPVWIGAKPDVQPNAILYLKIISLSFGLHCTGFVCSGVLRGSGNTRLPMMIAILTNIVNVSGNFLLIYPTRAVSIFGSEITLFGAGMGVKGAAAATSFAQLLSGAILLAFLFNRSLKVHVWLDRTFRFQPETILSILKIGLPAAGEKISLNIGMVLYQALVASLGTVEISAHYLANTIESISYMPAEGFAMAATTLVGQSLGAGNRDDAEVYGGITITSAALCGAVCGTVFMLFPHALFSLFSNDAGVIMKGGSALRVMAAVEPFLCAAIVTTGALRGAGDTKFPFLSTALGIWGVRQLAALFFAYGLGLGLTGAWIGMAMDIMLRFILLRIRYTRRKWLYIKI